MDTDLELSGVKLLQAPAKDKDRDSRQLPLGDFQLGVIVTNRSADTTLYVIGAATRLTYDEERRTLGLWLTKPRDESYLWVYYLASPRAIPLRPGERAVIAVPVPAIMTVLRPCDGPMFEHCRVDVTGFAQVRCEVSYDETPPLTDPTASYGEVLHRSAGWGRHASGVFQLSLAESSKGRSDQ